VTLSADAKQFDAGVRRNAECLGFQFVHFGRVDWFVRS